MKILLIDDSLEYRQTFMDLAKVDPVTDVLVAENGKDAIEKLQTFAPDVILLDLLMPLMNGWEFLDLTQKNPTIARIPVILFTSHGGIKEQLPEERVAGVLSKNVGPEELIKQIANLVEDYHAPIDKRQAEIQSKRSC